MFSMQLKSKSLLSWVCTSGFHMRFPHCVVIFYNLPWLSKTKVSYKKSQCNAVNVCGNRMCKLSFKQGSNVARRPPKRSVATSVLRMRLLHVVAFSKKLRCLAQTKVITLKMQQHAVNARWKRLSQLNLRYLLGLMWPALSRYALCAY